MNPAHPRFADDARLVRILQRSHLPLTAHALADRAEMVEVVAGGRLIALEFDGWVRRDGVIFGEPLWTVGDRART